MFTAVVNRELGHVEALLKVLFLVLLFLLSICYVRPADLAASSRSRLSGPPGTAATGICPELALLLCDF